MKRRLLCALLVGVALTLTACGGNSSSQTGGQISSGQTGGGKTEEGYAFQVNAADNYAVTIDGDMADVLAALGEPNSYFEAASCAFDGLDKTYTYAGFVITTRPEGEKDFVNSILLTDDSVTTPEGVYIGCPAEDVTAVYGEGGATDTLMTRTSGNTAINFVLEEGKVISIEYLPA